MYWKFNESKTDFSNFFWPLTTNGYDGNLCSWRSVVSLGIEYSSAMAIVIQFSIFTQLIVVLITLGLPRWLGHSL